MTKHKHQSSHSSVPLCLREGFLGIILLLAVPTFLHAQTADQVEVILQTPEVNCAQAAWVVVAAASIGNFDRSGPERTFQFASEKNWLPKNAAPTDKINLMQTSLLIMQVFNIKGGMWYTLFKNPHYAYRELVHQQIIQGRVEPRMAVSGELLLFLIERVMYLNTDDPWAVPKTQGRERAEKEQALVEEINSQLESLEVADTTVRVTDEGVTISLSNIQFLADSAVLPEQEKQKIQEIARILSAISARRILVTGHTAQAGTEAGRQQISLDRAQSVADYLVELGVRKADELVVQGHGSQRPLASGNSAEAMALNRRVEITILEDQE